MVKHFILPQMDWEYFILNEPLVIQADWLVPITSAPIPQGFLVIHHGRVAHVGRNLPAVYASSRSIQLNRYAILPGLVNSHCHLEFSDLAEPIPAGDSFPAWIRKVLTHRGASNRTPEQIETERSAAIAKGVRESYIAGVRWIVDMTNSPWQPKWIDEVASELQSDALGRTGYTLDSPIVVQPCMELIDIVERRNLETKSFAIKQLSVAKSPFRGEVGLAPHAPYTASLSIADWAAEIASEARLVSMHLAESADEVQWLADRNGPFAELLSPLISDNYFDDRGITDDYLRVLCGSWRALIAHGNYLSESDLALMARRSNRLALVHCPRTHKHFGHGYYRPSSSRSTKYPMAERVSSGVKHFLGTDSRASNPDLNLWREAQSVRLEHPEIAPLSILAMVTTEPAEYLQLGARYGALAAGQPASLTAIQLVNAVQPDASSADTLYESLLFSETQSMPLEMAIRT